MPEQISRDFRKQKFALVVVILALGMVAALAWHGWQGWGLGRGYPYNTFLYTPNQRFSDLYVTYAQAKASESYSGTQRGAYLPFTYIFLKPLGWIHGFSDHAVCICFIAIWAIGMVVLLNQALRSIIPQPFQRLLFSALLPSLCYPIVYGLDRGNLEILMTVFIGLMLLLFQRGQIGWGVFCLLLPISCKLYPAILLALLVRRRTIFWIPVAAVACVAITIGSFALLPGPLTANWHDWQANVQAVKDFYTVSPASMALTSTPWNIIKLVEVISAMLFHPSLGHTELIHIIKSTAQVYEVVVLAALAGLVAYTIFVEREFFRRAILLLLGLVLCGVTGADYHMAYAGVALVVLILLPTERRGDLIATTLLAFVCIPKREVLLPFLGITDVDVLDFGNIGVFLNPLCMIAAIFILLWSGWFASPPGWGQKRLAGLLNMRPGMA